MCVVHTGVLVTDIVTPGVLMSTSLIDSATHTQYTTNPLPPVKHYTSGSSLLAGAHCSNIQYKLNVDFSIHNAIIHICIDQHLSLYQN